MIYVSAVIIDMVVMAEPQSHNYRKEVEELERKSNKEHGGR